MYSRRNRTEDDEATVVNRPDDPTFVKRTGKRDRQVNNKVPVCGIVTEPIQGQLQEGSWTEYIPSSHVKYLEQTGCKVVPISYQT
jgi:hypothetical protein